MRGKEGARICEAMDRLLADTVIRPWSILGALFQVETPLLDMYETQDEVVVEVAVPGVRPEGVEVGISGGTLTIKGGREKRERGRIACYIHQEQSPGRFCRSVTLPAGIDADQVTAALEFGMLILTFPKSKPITTHGSIPG